MTRLSDLPTDFYLDYYRQLPQIDEKDVSILWHDDYYDGPLNGMLYYQGKKHWFQIFKALQTDEVRHRVDQEEIIWNDHFVRYLVIELSEEQVKEEEYWHELFRQKVSTRTDYDERGRRKMGNVKSREMWDKFYEPYKMREALDLSKNVVIGWFESLWGSVEQEEDDDET